MAVTIKKDTDTSQDFGALVASKLGVAPALWQEAAALGYTAEKGINKILIKDKTGNVVSNVKAVQGALTFLMEDNLGATSAGHLKASFEQAVKKLIADHGDTPVELNMPPKVEAKIFPGGGAVNPTESKLTQQSPPLASIFGTDPEEAELNHTFNKPPQTPTQKSPPSVESLKTTNSEVISKEAVAWNEMDVMSPVKLLQATKLYQPVHGTSSGSRYFVVALSKDLKIAARFKGEDLSMRVEGNISKSKDILVENGFNIGADETYASMHLKCPTQILAKRVIGALLTGMDMELQSELPKFVALIGKGK